jgi:hypothetical protein
MSTELPPNPQQFRDLQQWAGLLYDYLLAQARISTANDPLPVLLPHRVNDERASVGGILLYDPVTTEVVMSDGSKWCPATCLPSYTATEIADETNEVNTRNKATGRVIYDSTNDTVMIANGAGATDTWSRLTVASTVTPS